VIRARRGRQKQQSVSAGPCVSQETDAWRKPWSLRSVASPPVRVRVPLRMRPAALWWRAVGGRTAPPPERTLRRRAGHEHGHSVVGVTDHFLVVEENRAPQSPPSAPGQDQRIIQHW